MRHFSIDESDLLDKSYVDYLLEGEDVHKLIKTLCIFENDKFFLCEIKRLDVGEDLSPDKIYFWFLFQKETQELVRLNFISKSTSQDQKIRIFSQGELKFDKNAAHLRLTDQKIELQASHFLSNSFKQTILTYFEQV